MDLNEILQQLDRLADLSAEELEALATAIDDAYASLRETAATDEDVAALSELVDAREAVRGEDARRATEAEAVAERLAELDRRITGEADASDGEDTSTDGEDDADDESGDDAGADDEASGSPPPSEADDDAGTGDGDVNEALAAGSRPAGGRRSLRELAARQPHVDPSRRRLPAMRSFGVPDFTGGDPLVASADVPHVTAGQRITNPETFGRALFEKHQALATGPGSFEKLHKFSVFRARKNFAHAITERQGRDPLAVADVMDQAVRAHLDMLHQQVAASMGGGDEEVRLASGGPCTVCTPDYNIPVIAGNTRPFTQAFPTVGFPRGSICFYPPLCYTRAGRSANIGRVITAAQDLAGYVSQGGPTADKACVHIDCPTQVTCGTDIVMRCVTIGNWIDRTLGEYVTAWQELVDSWYASRLEEKHMADFIAGSVALTAGPQQYGAFRDFLRRIMVVVEHARGARRLEATQEAHIAVPWWFITLLKMDLATGFGGSDAGAGFAQFQVTDAQLIAWFRQWNVNISTYLDEAGPTAGGVSQVMGALVAGAVPAMPLEARVMVWLEGDWIRGSGGELNLGVFRDSQLNKANDFQAFQEEWTKLCFRGCAGTSYFIDFTLCPNGASAGTVAPIVCV